MHIYLILNFESLCVLTASKTEWWCDLMVLFVLDQNCWMKSNNWRKKKNSKTDHLKLSLLTCNNFYYFVPRHCFPRYIFFWYRTSVCMYHHSQYRFWIVMWLILYSIGMGYFIYLLTFFILLLKRIFLFLCMLCEIKRHVRAFATL